MTIDTPIKSLSPAVQFLQAMGSCRLSFSRYTVAALSRDEFSQLPQPKTPAVMTPGLPTYLRLTLKCVFFSFRVTGKFVRAGFGHTCDWYLTFLAGPQVKNRVLNRNILTKFKTLLNALHSPSRI